jgi:hypothetical protein
VKQTSHMHTRSGQAYCCGSGRGVVTYTLICCGSKKGPRLCRVVQGCLAAAMQQPCMISISFEQSMKLLRLHPVDRAAKVYATAACAPSP